MKLIYRDPEGVKTTQLFPFGAGEWTAGDVREFDDNQATLLLQHFGGLIFPLEDHKPPKRVKTVKKEKEPVVELEPSEPVKNEFKEKVEEASDKVKKFYKKSELEGGEI